MPNEPLDGFSFDNITPETVQVPGEDFSPPKPRSKWQEFWGGKKAQKPREKTSRKPPAPMPRGGLRKPLEDLYTGLGIMMMPFDPSCAQIVISQAPKCAEALDDLAKTNPAVRRILIGLVTTSAWGQVIAAHAPILMALAMHHIPALRERQEKMVGDAAEMFLRMQPNNGGAQDE
jgi:hypothetical protein